MPGVSDGAPPLLLPAGDLFGRPGGVNPQFAPGNPLASEPNLMPVPSPQQIQYINNFEGQELTIHKQANTGLRDAADIRPPS